MTQGPNLLEKEPLDLFCAQLIDLEIKAEMPLQLVIFDTLSRSIPGGDENKAEDMTKVISAADKIRDTFRAATLYVHHTGKDPAKGARGHSALFAAADMVMLINEHMGTLEKVRDGVAGERFAFRLDVHQLGLDADGDPVTTCLISELGPPAAAPAKRRKPVGKRQQVVLEVIRRHANEIQDVSPGSSIIPRGALMCRFPDILEKSLKKFPDEDPYRMRARIKDAVTSLLAAEFIGVHDDIIWLPC